MFKNNFLKRQTFDTERHFLNAFQRAPFPFLNSLCTYTRLEIVFAAYKQDLCSVLRHLLSD